MSAWSDQTPLSVPLCFIPGPTSASQVVVISGETVPWFQAKLGLTVAQGELQSGAPAKRKYFGSANIVNVGVPAGSAVIMCRRLIPTGPARSWVGVSVAP